MWWEGSEDCSMKTRLLNLQGNKGRPVAPGPAQAPPRETPQLGTERRQSKLSKEEVFSPDACPEGGKRQGHCPGMSSPGLHPPGSWSMSPSASVGVLVNNRRFPFLNSFLVQPLSALRTCWNVF